MATKKTLEFTAKNVKALTSWLKRFSSIDNTLLLEIDQSTSSFIAKAYNEERSVVKMSVIKFDEAGLAVKSSKDAKRVKVGIFNIPRLIKIMDQFNDVEFALNIEYQDLVGDTETQYVAEKILFKNKNLKMNVDCTSLNIFKYIADDLFRNNIATIDSIGSFALTRPAIEKVNTLNSLDSDNKFMEFSLKEGKSYVSGKTYEYVIEDSNLKKDAAITIFKEQYSALDIENYKVELGEDRLVFKSSDSDTVCVISMASEKE